jgi:hypothetical protein
MKCGKNIVRRVLAFIRDFVRLEQFPAMSAFGGKADISGHQSDVCF